MDSLPLWWTLTRRLWFPLIYSISMFLEKRPSRWFILQLVIAIPNRGVGLLWVINHVILLLFCDWAKRDCFWYNCSPILKFSFWEKKPVKSLIAHLYVEEEQWESAEMFRWMEKKDTHQVFLLKIYFSETSRASTQILGEEKASFFNRKKPQQIKSIKITVTVSKSPIWF